MSRSRNRYHLSGEYLGDRSLKLFYTDQFVLPLPAAHRFPMQKYSGLRERIARSDWSCGTELLVPPAVTNAEILRVHDPGYLERVTVGALDREDLKRLGFPWSTELIERSRRSSGATLAAGRSALVDGFAANLAGGTHHAFRDRAEGYCIFNDTMIAARGLQAEGLIRRAVVIDLDVHQGNGTAALARGDDTIFTFSMHSARNYPFAKETSDLDLALADGAGDVEYLTELRIALPAVLEAAEADLAFFLAGADPYVGDRLGRLALTKAGLAERDRTVFSACRDAGLPVVVSMAGGYCPQIEDIVDIHAETVRLGLKVCGRQPAKVGTRVAGGEKQ